MKEKKIAREERNQEKLANGDWVMAEFYATWCPHCQRMKPVVEEFKKLMEGTLEVVLVWRVSETERMPGIRHPCFRAEE